MADFQFTVTKEEEGQEIRLLMRKHFDFSSRLRNRIKREKLLLRNGEPEEGWHPAVSGDVIKVVLPEERSRFEAEPIELHPVFEDDDLLILNKQPGVVVHPTKGHLSGTIANGLMHYMNESGQSFKIRFVNRLDMDTSGLLVVAKNAYAQTDYIRQADRGGVIKKYSAIVSGCFENHQGTIDLPIAPPLPGQKQRRVTEDGAPSITHYRVLDSYAIHGLPSPSMDKEDQNPDSSSDGSCSCSLVELRLETGRTHQIRVHMSCIGHPVLGDTLYGESSSLIPRQALHASSLEFLHPTTKKELHLKAPLPDDMKHVLSILSCQAP